MLLLNAELGIPKLQPNSKALDSSFRWDTRPSGKGSSGAEQMLT